MRVLALLITPLTLVALTLTCVTIFAGSNEKTLGTVDIVTVNGTAGSNRFISAHVLTTCAGSYTSEDGGSKKTVNDCTDRRVSSFDQDGLEQPISLPEPVNERLKNLRPKFRTMFYAYMVGAVLTALAEILSLFGICIAKPGVSAIGAVVAFLSFLALIVASTIATILAASVVNVAKANTLQASRGSKFLGLTWVATLLMFLVLIGWVVGSSYDRKARKKGGRSGGKRGGGRSGRSGDVIVNIG